MVHADESKHKEKILGMILATVFVVVVIAATVSIIRTRANIDIETKHRVEKTAIESSERLEREKIRQEEKTKRAQEWIKVMPWNRDKDVTTEQETH